MIKISELRNGMILHNRVRNSYFIAIVEIVELASNVTPKKVSFLRCDIDGRVPTGTEAQVEWDLDGFLKDCDIVRAEQQRPSFPITPPWLKEQTNKKEVVEKVERIDVMLDIESLSTDSNGAIIQLAAVVFDIHKKGHGYVNFNKFITPKSAIDAGLTINADTMKWWFSQEESVQKKVLAYAIERGNPLKEVLMSFTDWLEELKKKADKVFVWGYPVTSDLTWLLNAFKAVNLPYPIEYNRTRDLATIADLYWEVFGEKLSDKAFTRINHDAIVDCQAQIEMVCHAYDKFKNGLHKLTGEIEEGKHDEASF